MSMPVGVAEAFALAIETAGNFAGATAPNPPVGCVALDAGGEVLACEAHQRAGGAHAEVAVIEACRKAGVLSRIEAFVVTLEPCNHHGRTPPCVDAILTTAARTVWVGVTDPNLRVCGGGTARLKAKGVEVHNLLETDDLRSPALRRAAARLVAPFKMWSNIGRPWITLKQAIAANGSMIPPRGCTTFTSADSLILAHHLRRRSDAILTGSGCVLADCPAFTVRYVPDHPNKSRILAILDRRGRIPSTYIQEARTRGFDVRIRPQVDDLLQELAANNVLEVLVEAGPTLAGSLLESGLWDERVLIRQQQDPSMPDTVQIELR